MGETLELTLGLTPRNICRSLVEGAVQPEGVRIRSATEFGHVHDATERHRQILNGTIDGGEFSTSSLFLAQQHGTSLVALPVFLARGFCHRSMLCAETSPMRSPADLRGRRVSVHRYNNTVAVWMRTVLAEEYGVAASDLSWHVSEPDLEGEGAAPGVEVHHLRHLQKKEDVLGLVMEGQIDAVLEAYLRPVPGVRRLVADYRQAEADSFRRTGVFPIFHTLVLRASLVEEHPWLVDSLVEAFQEARARAQAAPTAEERAEQAWLEDVLGHDPYAYELDACAVHTLETMQATLVREGLLRTPVPVETLFGGRYS